MSGLDFVLLFFLAGYIITGWSAGLIYSVGSLLGIGVGAFAASRWYDDLAPHISGLMGGNDAAASIVAFTILFVFSAQIFALLVTLVNKIFNMVAIVPGMKFTNRVGGAILGALQGALALGITLQLASRIPLTPEIQGGLEGSSLAPFFMSTASWLVALLPKVLRDVQGII